MKKPELYNYTMSICSMKTRLAMEEFGLPFEDKQVDIGFALENFEPDYVRLNERCVVPTLVVGGEVTTDSARIVKRIADLAGKGMPAEDEQRAQVLDWFEQGDTVNFQVITYGRKGVPRGDELLVARKARALEYAEKYPDLKDVYEAAHARITNHGNCAYDAATCEKAEADMVAKLDRLNEHMSERDYIAGTEYTIADVMWTVLLARIEMLGLLNLIEERAHLLSYYRRLQERPSFAKARVMPNWKGGI